MKEKENLMNERQHLNVLKEALFVNREADIIKLIKEPLFSSLQKF